MSSEESLHVSEMFYSVQGEGMTAGTPAVFLRLTGCNLTCPGWGTTGCDTTAVWRRGEKMTFAEILTVFRKSGWWNVINRRLPAHLIITGGEPLLQEHSAQSFVIHLYQLLTDANFVTVEWETNCTREPDISHLSNLNKLRQLYNCSPKLASAGNSSSKSIVPKALQSFSDLSWSTSWVRSSFKFVVQTETDLDQVLGLVREFSINPERIYLMPEGASQQTLHPHYALVMEMCKRTGFKFSPRLHITAWDQATGV